GGFHLRHPDYTRGLMALALCSGNAILKWAEEKSQGWSKLEKFSSFDMIAEEFNLPPKKAIKSVFYDKDKSRAVDMLPNIMKCMGRMEDFEKHEKSIIIFLNKILENKQINPQLL